MGRDGVVRTLAPRRNAHFDALLQSVRAKVCAPRPTRDDDVDGSARGIDAHLSVSTVHQRTHVAALQLARFDELERSRDQLVCGIRNFGHADFRRADETLHVVLKTEDVACVGFFVIVATHAFEHGRPVMKRMGEYVGGAFRPGNQLAVLPDILRFLYCHDRCSFRAQCALVRCSTGHYTPSRWSIWKFYPQEITNVLQRGLKGASEDNEPPASVLDASKEQPLAITLAKIT